MATFVPNPIAIPHLLTVKQAAIIAGIPYSTMRKAFMRDPSKRPAGIPEPPPHKYEGRRIRVFARYLESWALNNGCAVGMKKRGRPTKAEAARRQQMAA